MTSHEKILQMRSNASFSKHNKNYWDKKNDAALRKMYNEGYGISEMALKMGRTENSISKRIKDLRFDVRRYNTKGRNSKKDGCLCDRCSLYKSRECNGATSDCEYRQWILLR